MTMDTEASLREYLKLQLRIPVVGRIGPLAKAFDFVASAAPGVREILTVGKLCYEVRERNYDLVVVDGAGLGPYRRSALGATGHQQSGQGGTHPGRRPTGCSTSSPTTARPGWWPSVTPEEMPVNETIELADRVKRRDHGPTFGGRGQPGPARALRPSGGGGVREPGPGRVPLRRCGRTGGWRRRARCWTPPAWL